jgi:peptidoglycan pentaglycine glycine transferase (the first glycine)
MYIRKLEKEELNSFVLNHENGSVFQTYEYTEVQTNLGFQSMYLGFFIDDELKGSASILIKKVDGYKYGFIKRGFLTDFNNLNTISQFSNQLITYLGKENVIGLKMSLPILKEDSLKYNFLFDYLIANNFYHFGYNNYFEALDPRFEAIIDLDEEYTQIIKKLKKTLKNRIKQAEDKDVKIYKTDVKKINYIYNQTKNKLHYSKDHFKLMFDNYQNNIDYFYSKINPDEHLDKVKKKYFKEEENNTYLNDLLTKKLDNKNLNLKLKSDEKFAKLKKELLEATETSKKYKNDVILATAIIVRHNDTAYILVEGYNKVFKNFNAKHLMLIRLIEFYKNQGIKKLNIGGITNPDYDSDFDGLNQFKLAFNPNILEFAGDFELITNSQLYFMYRNKVTLKNLFKL